MSSKSGGEELGDDGEFLRGGQQETEVLIDRVGREEVDSFVGKCGKPGFSCSMGYLDDGSVWGVDIPVVGRPYRWCKWQRCEGRPNLRSSLVLEFLSLGLISYFPLVMAIIRYLRLRLNVVRMLRSVVGRCRLCWSWAWTELKSFGRK